jgi:hypothetical protein
MIHPEIPVTVTTNESILRCPIKIKKNKRI